MAELRETERQQRRRLKGGEGNGDVPVVRRQRPIRWWAYGVRSGVATSREGRGDDPWLEGAEYEDVVPRDIQRLPLGRYVRAALAIVNDPLTGEGRREARRILMPRGKPDAAGSRRFYEELLEVATELEAQGRPAVAEIARRKGVDENTVHQWLHRARRRSGEST